MKVTNTSDISLAMAVWLLHDEYDYVNDKANYISVTSLLKSTKQAVLAGRIPYEERAVDVQDFIARSYGHAIHDSIERAWTSHEGRSRALKLLGYPQSVINRVLVNPTPEQLAAIPDPIPVYLEQRAFKEVTVNGVTFTIGGKFDMIADGIITDHKSTSAFAWMAGTRDDDHQKQVSSYRWLNPDKVLEDHADINYIFTDWSRAQARASTKYPQKRVERKKLELMSMADTEAWITSRVAEIYACWNLPEEKIPACTDKELWRSDPVYKFYADANKTSGRSTKNFDNKAEAMQFQSSKGGGGIVITVPGEAKACSYCAAFDVCKQKDSYFS